jgi:uncharacterized protein
MNRNLLLAVIIASACGGFALAQMASANQKASPARIEGFGQVTPFPDAPEQPRDGSKFVVDLTAGGPADQLNPGLDKVARFVNIYSQAGKQPAGARISVVLHGDATALSLHDKAYAEAFKTESNPNLPLLRKLRGAGVEFLVCGQALTIKGFQPDQTTKDVAVAVSGLTALVNRQEDGYAYVPLSK